MSGWKTVEAKRNRKVKKAARDYSDSDDESHGYNQGSNTDYQVSSSSGTAAGRLMSAYHQSKAEASKKREPTRYELNAVAAKEAEALEKKRAERKASAADEARLKRRAAQEHAKKANDVSKWPTIAEQLAEQSEAFMDHFDNVMEEDPIVSNGGIGALLLYAPSIFEKFLHKTRLLDEEKSGDVLLSASIEEQSEDYPEALDTFVYYKSLLSKMPEVKACDSNSSDRTSNQAVLDGMIALLTAVWGLKGLSNPLATSKDSGRGGVLAVELTFEQLWSIALKNILEIAAGVFVNSAKGEAHGPQSVLNFQRIFTVITNAANQSDDKDAARIAIARAGASLLIHGYMPILFPDPKNEDTMLLTDVIASAIRYVSAKQLSNKAYAGLPFTTMCPSAGQVIKSRMEGAKVGGAWSVIGIELMARQNPTLAKATVGPLLEALDRELSGAETFSPAESTPVVMLSTVFALHASAAMGALRTAAPKTPKAGIVFLAVAKASKLFDVPPALKEAVVAAAKKAGASAPKMSNNVKVTDHIPAKEEKGGKKATSGSNKNKAADGKEDGAEEGKKAGGGFLRILMSVAMMCIATALVAYQSNAPSTPTTKKAAAQK